MRKTIITLLAVVFCAVSVGEVSAQKDQRDKGTETIKGYNLLPAKGDFGIGIGIGSFLQYDRNLFTGNADPKYGYGGNVYGKYFVRNNQALRFGLNVGVKSRAQRFKVRDDATFLTDPTNNEASAFDIRTIAGSNFGLFVGYEWRRGYGRLQAFYGVDAGFDFGYDRTSYNWGNPMTEANQTPTSNPAWTGGDPTPNVRPMSAKNTNFSAGVRGFAGVEFFFARKMSIGLQTGIGVRYANTSQTTVTNQVFDTAMNRIDERKTRAEGNNGGSNWDANSDLSGNVFLMFYF